MDCSGALLLCLCLLTARSGTAETLEELQRWIENIEKPRSRALAFPRGQVRALEQKLLKADFQGPRLTLRTDIIQSLVFKLDCNFTGLSLSSDSLEQNPKAQPSHAMELPAELTQAACVTSHRKLRLICVYFSSTFFFQDDDNSSLLNNYVLGAQLDHGHVSNLRETVNISFWHNQSLEDYTVTCVFWNEGASKHYWGAWSPEGCRTEQPSRSQVLCHCNHLTYFAVLMVCMHQPG